MTTVAAVKSLDLLRSFVLVTCRRGSLEKAQPELNGWAICSPSAALPNSM